MRSFLLIGLVALATSTISAKERRSDQRFRKFGLFPPKDKRGTDYPHITSGPPTGLFHPIPGPTSSQFPRSISSYSQHQGLDQLGLNHASALSLMGTSLGGLGSMGVTLGTHNGQLYAVPIQTSKTTPVNFGLHNTLSAYMKPIYQTLNGYTSGPSHGSSMLSDTSSYGAPSYLPEYSGLQSLQSLQSVPNLHSIQPSSSTQSSHSYSPPDTSSGISGGLVFVQNSGMSYPSMSQSSRSPPSYHVGLSSGSSDSASYHLPVSSHSYPASQLHSKYRAPPASSAGSSYASSSSYSFPSTNYGIPNSLISHSSPASPSSNYGISNSVISHAADTPSSNYSPSSYSPTYTSSHSSYNPSSETSGSVNYGSSSGAYSDYPNQGHSSYGYEQQTSYSNVSPIHSNQASVKSYEESIPKYDTISYSSHSEKY